MPVIFGEDGEEKTEPREPWRAYHVMSTRSLPDRIPSRLSDAKPRYYAESGEADEPAGILRQRDIDCDAIPGTTEAKSFQKHKADDTPNGVGSGTGSKQARKKGVVRFEKVSRTSSTKAPDVKASVKKGLFVDRRQMKRELMKTLHRSQYDVAAFYWDTGLCQAAVRHTWFETVSFAAVALNAIWIAIEIDLNKSPALFGADPVFIVFENLFCACFAVEWLLRFGALRSKRAGLKDFWFVFDLVLVIVGVMETWCIPLVCVAMDSQDGCGLGNAGIVRLLKLLRLSRLMRIVRVVRGLNDLIILIKGIIAALRSVGFAFSLMVILTYIFAVAFRQLTSSTLVGEAYFSSVPHGMHALILEGVFWDNPGDLLDACVEDNDFALSFALFASFYCFVLFATMTVMNMLVGIVVKVVKEVASYEREELDVLRLRDALSKHIEKYRDKADNEIYVNKEAFKELLKHLDEDTLVNLEVDRRNLLETCDEIFMGEDDEPDRTMDMIELINVILEHRAMKRATKKNMTAILQYLRSRYSTTESEHLGTMLRLELTITALSKLIEDLAGEPTGTVRGIVDQRRRDEAQFKRYQATQQLIRKRTTTMCLTTVPAPAPAGPPTLVAAYNTWETVDRPGHTVQHGEAPPGGDSVTDVQQSRRATPPKVALQEGETTAFPTLPISNELKPWVVGRPIFDSQEGVDGEGDQDEEAEASSDVDDGEVIEGTVARFLRAASQLQDTE